jgi:hypothetical protein
MWCQCDPLELEPIHAPSFRVFNLNNRGQHSAESKLVSEIVGCQFLMLITKFRINEIYQFVLQTPTNVFSVMLRLFVKVKLQHGKQQIGFIGVLGAVYNLPKKSNNCMLFSTLQCCLAGWQWFETWKVLSNYPLQPGPSLCHLLGR